MKNRIIKGIAGITLASCVMLSLAGCGKKVQAADLMEGISSNTVETKKELTDTENSSVSGFGVRLFQSSLTDGENTLISPISVLYALGMTANGAEGETRSQMESVLGMSVDELNAYLNGYMAQLPESESYKLQLANAIWFKDDDMLTVNQDFLQMNANYYNAGAYKTPFDNSTLKDINNWVSGHTEERIKDIIDEIPEEAVMYLVNALAFDAEWQNIYDETQVAEGIFTKEDGETQTVDMMYSEESSYLEDENAVGFMKYYKDGKYAFAALLPKEGLSIADYVGTLSGEGLYENLTSAEDTTVNVTMPKFETSYDTDMAQVLIDMGMPYAFDEEKADFTGLGTYVDANLYINRVLHKTFIAVNEKGTEAGAATAVEMVKEMAMMQEEPKVVTLDRPFVYMIIDCENNVPIFIGTVMNVAE